jgi:hypothetical protein
MKRINAGAPALVGHKAAFVGFCFSLQSIFRRHATSASAFAGFPAHLQETYISLPKSI